MEGGRRVAKAALLVNGATPLLDPPRAEKKKAKRPSRFSPSRAVFFRRRAEVKQRLPSLSADAGVEHATRVTSREGGVIVLRAGARQKRGVKVVRGTRMQPPPQQRERERAGTRRRRPRSLHLPQRRRSTGSSTQPASQLLFPTERKRTWRDRTSVQPRRLRGGRRGQGGRWRRRKLKLCSGLSRIFFSEKFSFRPRPSVNTLTNTLPLSFSRSHPPHSPPFALSSARTFSHANSADTFALSVAEVKPRKTHEKPCRSETA